MDLVKTKAKHHNEILTLHGSRSSRLSWGMFATLLSQAINALGQVFLVPLFLAYWGNILYGEWLTLSATVAYISMFDFGMQTYVVNRLNQYFARRKMDDYIRILHSSLFLCLIIFFIGLILTSVAIIVMPLDRWFHFISTDHYTAKLVAVLLAIQVISAIPQGLITGIYRTIGEYPRGVMIGNTQRLLTIVLTVAVLLLGGGLIGVASIQLLPVVGASVYVWRDLKMRHSQIKLGVEKRDLKLALSLIGPSSLFFLIQISTGLTVQGSTLMVGATLGAASIVLFVTLRTLTSFIRQITGALNSTLWPELTALEAQGRYQVLRETHLLAIKITLIINICAAIILYFAGEEAIMLWTNGRINYDAQLMNAFLFLLILQTPWLVSSVILASSNNHQLLSICYIASAVAGLGLGYLMSQSLGLVGIVYGLLFADFFICGWLIPWKTCRMIEQDFSQFLIEVVLRGIPFVLLFYAVSYWLWGALSIVSEIIRLMIFVVAIGITGLILGHILWHNRQEKKILYRFIFKLLVDRFGYKYTYETRTDR